MRRLLGGHKDTADVDRQSAIEIVQGQLLHVAPYQYSGTVDEDVQSTEVGDCLADGLLQRDFICTVGANSQRLAASSRDSRDCLFCLVGRRDIGEGHGSAVASEAFYDGGTDAA
ncbi:hypothetical protein D3C72_1942690 [compost metagenome]